MENKIGTITTRTLGSADGYPAKYNLGEEFLINDFVTGEAQVLKVVSAPKRVAVAIEDEYDVHYFWKANCQRIA